MQNKNYFYSTAVIAIEKKKKDKLQAPKTQISTFKLFLRLL